jgi:Pectate lyase superfamily protein
VSVTQVNGWFDVTRNGTQTDYTTQINNCLASITANGGGTLYFPPGTYTANDTINPLPNNTTVQGCGMGTTIIQNTASTDAVIFSTQISNRGNTSPTAASCVITGLTISFGCTATTEWSGGAIRANCANGLTVTDVEIIDPYVGIVIKGNYGTTPAEYSDNVKCERVLMIMGANGYAGVHASGGDTVSNQEIHFTDCVVTGATGGATPLATYGFFFENASGVFMTSCSAIGCSYGLLMSPITRMGPSGDYTYSTFFSAQVTNCSFDANNYGAYFQTAYEGNQIYSIMLTGCSFVANVYAGVDNTPASGSLFSGIGFSGCTIAGNGLEGI